MYIAYIDASGRPTKEDAQTKNFALVSLIAHEHAYMCPFCNALIKKSTPGEIMTAIALKEKAES